ncbi:MAG TPA: TMEM175 family protein [Flavisolibacter sp.]|nr:TMEM175 family protein [Flavisolibacter sp.]
MKLGTTRVETFSDSVMSIVITVMVLSFKLPDFEKDGTHWSVRHHLYQMLPAIITYSFSFMMIGIFWVNHHHMFHLLKRTDEGLLVQNLLFLFCMSFIPLATAFVGSNPLIDESVAFYGLVMLMTTFSFAVMRTYSIRKRLIHRDPDKMLTAKIYRVTIKAKTKSYFGALAYLASIPLAFYNVYFSFACFAVPPILFFIPDGIDDEELSEKIMEKNQ